ncbi:MAG TPA: hypothetical protein VMU25_02885 [Candidatus Paceibacterota bacterium]|nr:hypothetical protein [Candidatus Paceibacterota bacterium]
MPSYRDSWVIRALLLLFFTILVIYAYFEARGILWGPSIQISSDISTVTTPYIEIKGTTTHIAELTLNGQSVPVTESGGFDIPYALSPGYNRLQLDAKDKYGKTTERVVQIILATPIGTPNATSSATSTATTKGTASSTATSTYPQESIPAASTTLMAH